MNQGATGSLTIAHCAQSACSDARFAVETSGDLGLFGRPAIRPVYPNCWKYWTSFTETTRNGAVLDLEEVDRAGILLGTPLC